ncbi:MAG: hypothetical protein IJT56_08860, partial [Clostridia bacterium]|nr:hypothetical protein [Clostridia bacterium]
EKPFWRKVFPFPRTPNLFPKTFTQLIMISRKKLSAADAGFLKQNILKKRRKTPARAVLRRPSDPPSVTLVTYG